MRILHICTDFWPSTGGIEKFVLDLARHSRQAGLETKVLCFNRIHSSSHTLPPQDQIGDIPIRRVSFLDLKYYRPTLLPLAELRQADVLHVHGIGAPLDFAAATKLLHRRPIVLSTHGGIFHTGKLPTLKQLYFHGLHRIIQRAVDCTVACSQQDLDLFQPVARKLILIENGVELAPFRQRHDAPKDPNRLVFVGRLSRNKGIENLIHAFHLLAPSQPHARLRIIGPDWENLQGSLQDLINRLDLSEKVTLTGQLPDEQMRQELQQAAFFVSASHYEGFGISAIEAMAAGCIPLLNDIPAFRNLIRDGENGFLINFNDSVQAADRLHHAMSHHTPQLTHAARLRAEDFSWEQKFPAWKHLYEQLTTAPAS
jgi:alpha-1,3-mannosyltransferase